MESQRSANKSVSKIASKVLKETSFLEVKFFKILGLTKVSVIKTCPDSFTGEVRQESRRKLRERFWRRKKEGVRLTRLVRPDHHPDTTAGKAKYRLITHMNKM